MPTELPRILLEEHYEKAAQEYLSLLPLEHFMEARSEATQREITLESLNWVREQRPDIQYFSELLVQYPLPKENKLGQVVPDNMVVVHSGPIAAEGSYAIPLQPVGPYWVLEYVSKGSRRKDYKDNKRRYEMELKVPYYLLFEPHKQKLQLYRMTRGHYVFASANELGRLALPELEIEVALLNGWVRFWFRGELVPLPGEMQRSLDEAKETARAEKRRADTASRRAKASDRRAEGAELLAQEANRRAEEANRRAEEADRRVEAERQARLERDEEIARLRALLEVRETSTDELRTGQNET